MEKFLVISSDNNYTLNIFDFEKMQIVILHNGVFTDETENCQKMTKRKQTVIGGLWYKFLHGEIDRKQAYIYENEISLATDDKMELDKFILSVQKMQIENLLKNCNLNIRKMENNKQYYTYRFQNGGCDNEKHKSIRNVE